MSITKILMTASLILAVVSPAGALEGNSGFKGSASNCCGASVSTKSQSQGSGSDKPSWSSWLSWGHPSGTGYQITIPSVGKGAIKPAKNKSSSGGSPSGCCSW